MVMLGRWLLRTLFFLYIGPFHRVLGAFVGVNIGTQMSDLPSASNIVEILKSNQITHIRLYNSNPHMLTALANTSIDVIVGVTNREILRIAHSPSVAASWVNKNVAAYVPGTNITAIAVGNEVLNSAPHASPALVPAMNNLHKALIAANLNFRVKVSTPNSMDIISKPFPPSAATYNSSWNTTMYLILQFLKNTDSYFMLNAFPYYGYTMSNGIFPLDYALFRTLSPVKQIVDPNTLFHYDSMFDAMVDAAYYSNAALKFSDIPVVVTETGWPWHGGANEPDAKVEYAETFNKNLIRRVLNNTGPPSHKDVPLNTYIYELFNEDKKRGPDSEKNWGVFFTNGSTVYPISLSNSSSGNSSGVFCVAKEGVDTDKLKLGLDWACGPGHANCSAIQKGQPCFNPDTVKNHASYAYNDYYQRMHSVGGTCDFDGTATITAVDPSYGSCAFAGSPKIASSARTAPEPASSQEGSSSMRLVPEIGCLTITTIILYLSWF